MLEFFYYQPAGGLPMTALDRRLEIALALAKEAGEMALAMWPPPGAPAAELKGRQDWLTEADGAIERFLSAGLADALPEDGFQGEEGGLARGGALRWVVDPIDGTSNYARGSARFCVSLGLLEGTVPLLGVLVAPALSETYAARQGGGATLNGAPIRAAATTDLSRAQVEVGWSARRPNTQFLELVTKVLGSGAMMRAGGSGAMGLADVASGRLDAYVELHINLWDVAGALPILAEAGAITNKFVATNGPEIFAAAPGIAEALKQATNL
jgi:myo-inositol-1(or 4)-monophosphatase